MTPPLRFLTLAQVADELAASPQMVYSLVRSGELPAIKVGGRGQWRVERARLEEWVAARYEETRRFVETHPWQQPREDAR